MIDEHSIKNSFRAVKGDIISLQGEIFGIKEQLIKILIALDEISLKIKKPVNQVKKKPVKKTTSKKK
ncbi:MAG: hypothetical protein KKF67_01815 [Nanoarchaeota archaeon]|nr:hypothetical protein [Nanoarchaeota archaeon]